MTKLEGWWRPAAYGALFLGAFLLALRQTFPFDALRDRMVAEAAAQGWQLKVVDAGPAGLMGVRLTDLALESREGLRIPLEEVRASPRLLPLVLGRRGFDYQARLLEGRVSGLAEETRGSRHLTALVSGLDLSRSAALRRATGLEVGGKVEGQVDLTLDAREPARSSGKVDLRIEKAAVLGGQVPVAAFGGGGLTVPRADLGTVLIQGQVREGRATLDKVEARSADLELIGEGLAVSLQPRLGYSPIFGKVRLKLADAFWQKSGTASLRGMAEAALAPARGRDGAYWFQVYGTLSQPLTRPGQ